MNIKSVSYAYNLQDIVAAISETLDLIDPALSGHHRRTAYIASRIARECGLKESDVADIMIAGGMHDIGALSLREKFNAANFESTTHEAELQTHAEAGYHLLKEFAPFLRVAEIIRYHHILWRYGDNVCSPSVGSLSFILNLADRIDVTLSKQKPILAQVETVHDIILKNSGMLFVPEYVEAFIQLSKKESFWFDLIHFTTDELFKNRLTMHSVELPRDEVLGLAKVVAHIIDYRSRFTATHSSGVAKVARILAEEFSFSQDDAIQMEIAGYFHDIGKLAVPDVILEKNAPLSLEESHIMRIHPYYGREILKKVKG
ncbi:MAG TPA: HD domain-containing protein, partial [Spirochaetia bacterium]|nr:HD domain-containing protein [Spirochaetia bacterium]